MRLTREASVFCLFFTGLIVALGTFWAFQRGGQDFAVFHSSWRLVMEGRALEIYSDATPDRFLYAPGFAWLLAPVGLLPRDIALAIWSLAKAAAIGLVIRAFALRLKSGPFFPSHLSDDYVVKLGFASLGVLLMSRPILIDFQYGQVNSFIMAAAVWALLGRSGGDAQTWRGALRWFVFATLAVTKLFPGPLLLVPFLATAGFSRKQLRMERLAAVLGALFVLILPVVSVGFSGLVDLLFFWKQTLLQKGMPMETHNQSFTAFLMHFFSGQATPVLAQGGARTQFGAALLPLEWIRAVAAVWALGVLGFMFFWIRRVWRVPSLTWAAVLVGVMILPSHLIWKPYFVMSIPVAILALHRLVSVQGFYRGPLARGLALVLFAAINLSGFDFVGAAWGARFEAAAVLFWCHLAMLAVVLWPQSKAAPASGRGSF